MVKALTAGLNQAGVKDSSIVVGDRSAEEMKDAGSAPQTDPGAIRFLANKSGPRWDRRFIRPAGGLIVGTDPVAVDAVARALLDEKRAADGMDPVSGGPPPAAPLDSGGGRPYSCRINTQPFWVCPNPYIVPAAAPAE